ncbi:MAG TPA: glucose-6-phosphate dehydrogenase [bacterium]|nr:glucose-6-phosphate dehydrogenase [bacterium]HPN44339.1 glucose-6-phosphate dehydrogenase [bacterium]
MNTIINDNPLRQGMRLKRLPQPCTLIILGATGDLTKRKLIPALFSLFKQELLPQQFRIIAFARRPKTTADFVADMRQGLQEFAGIAVNDRQAEQFLALLHYHQGDFTEIEPHRQLAGVLQRYEAENGVPANRLFYLATPPSQYEAIVQNLGAAGLANSNNGWTRIIIEKPFGHDLASAMQLSGVVGGVFREEQIYRIDHYLGKETVQNILVFRFANGIFEPVWNRRYIDHVQITVAETLGVEGRGRFYEETGIIRDIMQNHILQLFSLFAMEPPAAFDATAVRDEKVKVLKAVKPLSPEDIDRKIVYGQYAAGSLLGKDLSGYLQEEGVAPDSITATYIAMKLYIDNWRWAGVPFYLRAGKRLPKRVTEIAIQFREAPLQIFGVAARDEIAANVLTLKIQPDEGISLKFDSKVPGPGGNIRPVTMDFRYGTSFGETPPDAYERLLLDAMIGDSTLFTRADENERAWEIITPALEHGQKLSVLPQYSAGSWGPAEAEELLKRDRRAWRRL